MNDGFRYKLRMMGIPIMRPTNIFCDNQSVVNNSTKPESVLKKKHLSICYHEVRECCACYGINNRGIQMPRDCSSRNVNE